LAENAIIGGTGVYQLDGSSTVLDVGTPYGAVRVYIKETESGEVVFLPRHGRDHSTPPHRINYRANIKALRQLGVKRVLATAAVGSLNMDFPPGSLVIPDQFIDFTRQRAGTFYDGEDGVVHTDMADPYCPALIKALEQKAAKAGLEIRGRGTYVCVEGPRFETKAEIRFFKSIGGDMVGMTGVPEVVLARELGLCYAAVGIVTNWCNGMVEQPISHREIFEIMKRGRENVSRLFLGVLGSGDTLDECRCGEGIIRL
jgi:5'-methylthioadenosine phosphorylase